jgi:hypothetical protein
MAGFHSFRKARVVTCVPSVPKATGAVLKIRVKTNASIGGKPPERIETAALLGDVIQAAPGLSMTPQRVSDIVAISLAPRTVT